MNVIFGSSENFWCSHTGINRLYIYCFSILNSSCYFLYFFTLLQFFFVFSCQHFNTRHIYRQCNSFSTLQYICVSHLRSLRDENFSIQFYFTNTVSNVHYFNDVLLQTQTHIPTCPHSDCLQDFLLFRNSLPSLFILVFLFHRNLCQFLNNFYVFVHQMMDGIMHSLCNKQNLKFSA